MDTRSNTPLLPFNALTVSPVAYKYVISKETPLVKKICLVVALIIGCFSLILPLIELGCFVGKAVKNGISSSNEMRQLQNAIEKSKAAIRVKVHTTKNELLKKVKETKKTLQTPKIINKKNGRKIQKIVKETAKKTYKTSTLATVVGIATPFVLFARRLYSPEIQHIDRMLCNNTNICETVVAPIRYELIQNNPITVIIVSIFNKIFTN